MVYVYAKHSKLVKYIGKKLSVSEIEETLKDMGMDVKGDSGERDPTLKIEITSEKTDMVSVAGISRAIRYYRGFDKELPKYKVSKAEDSVIVYRMAEKVRPKTVCVILRDVDMSEELLDEMIEIQEKIHESFGRNRKKASIGVYPCDDFEFPVSFTAQKPKDIVFRPLESDKEMNGYEILKYHDTGKKYAHLLSELDYFPVFRDKNENVLSMPPIINSHSSGRVGLHHRDLFIEISGHNLTYLDSLLKVIVTTFIEMGAKAQAVSVKYPDGSKYEIDLGNTEFDVSLEYVNKLIGFSIKPNQVEKLLNKVMLGLKKIKGDKLTVLVPPFRTDIWHDCDIADDIARAYGYNNIGLRFPSVSSIGETLVLSDFRDRLNDTMVGFGFIQLYTYMLTSVQTQFRKMELGKGDKNYVKLVDCEEQGLNMIRARVLPEILESLHINRRNKYPQKVFESGFVIKSDSKTDTKSRDCLHLCVAVADPNSNYTVIKGVLDTFAKLNGLDFDVKELSNVSFLIEGRAAEIFYKSKSVGFIGEIRPQVLENFGLLVPVCAFELVISDIFELMK